MVYHIGNTVVNIPESIDEFNKTSARYMMEQVNKKPDSVMGFATGGTPVGAYRELIELYKSGRISFEMVKSFNLDEYYPIKKDNSQSYFRYMNENLFNHIDIKPENVHLPCGEAVDPNTECDAYEKKIIAAGGIDFQLLGIGTNGHIGFNEPDDKFPCKTHLVGLNQSTIDDNARFFDSRDEVPRKALTMGIKTIMSAKKILFIASGANKAAIIKEAFFGDITPHVPASVLQLHTSVIIVLDEAAAADIKDKLE
ncbi:MAG: glucosamine-6-phosphate deaminase [Defluviitaleaceae bacterium]|nr:glucosamine-6-phosphate deaminase [Defluviitaleaceae bacterium]